MGCPLALRNLFINQEWQGWMCLVWVVNQEWSDTDYISIYTEVSLRDQVMNINEIVAVTLEIGMALTLLLQWPWPWGLLRTWFSRDQNNHNLIIPITHCLTAVSIGGGWGGLPIQKNILDALLFSTIYSRILKHFMQQQAARASCNYRHDYKDEWQYHALLRSPCVTRSTLLPCASSQWRHF